MSSDATKYFSDVLEDLIKKSGKNIKLLAKEINISYGSLSKYQNDKAEAGIDALYKIATYFDVSTDFLLGLSKEPTMDVKTRSISEYTGLSSQTIDFLHSFASPEIRSFYRSLFDRLVSHGEDELTEIPEYILCAAQAHVIAERANSDSRRNIDNSVATLIRDGDSYKISASEAEQQYELMASTALCQALANVVGDLLYYAVQRIKEYETIDPSDFMWISSEDSQDEK